MKAALKLQSLKSHIFGGIFTHLLNLRPLVELLLIVVVIFVFCLVIFLSVALIKIANTVRFKIKSKGLGKHHCLLLVQKVILVIKIHRN